MHVYDRYENRYVCKNHTSQYGIRVSCFDTEKDMIEELLKWNAPPCLLCIKQLEKRMIEPEQPCETCESCKYHEYDLDWGCLKCLQINECVSVNQTCYRYETGINYEG